jgi:hypothetical protein
MLSSYVGENDLFMQQYLSGELEIEFNPKHPRRAHARRRRRIPGFYTKTGVGTQVAEGKEHKDFAARPTLWKGIFADLAIVKAWKADETGNAVFRKTARNFNVRRHLRQGLCDGSRRDRTRRHARPRHDPTSPASTCTASFRASMKSGSNSARRASGRRRDMTDHLETARPSRISPNAPRRTSISPAGGRGQFWPRSCT